MSVCFVDSQISAALGLAIDISHGKRGGVVKISYREVEQLDEVCRRLSGVGSTPVPLAEDPLTEKDETASAAYATALTERHGS